MVWVEGVCGLFGWMVLRALVGVESGDVAGVGLALSFFSNNDRVDSQHRRLPLPLRSGTSTREDS